MADVHDIATRSYNMSRIRAIDTRPEMIVRKFLHGNGLRYRLHNKALPGKPDLTIPKYRTVIFVNGCFWHGHVDCKYFVMPKTRTAWWEEKIENNRKRDEKNLNNISKLGWQSIVIFECELKCSDKETKLRKLLKKIKDYDK